MPPQVTNTPYYVKKYMYIYILSSKYRMTGKIEKVEGLEKNIFDL